MTYNPMCISVVRSENVVLAMPRRMLKLKCKK
jgi:hypothetical protein